MWREEARGGVVARVGAKRFPSDSVQPFAHGGAEASWEDAGNSGAGGEEDATAGAEEAEDDIADEPPKLYA